MTDHHCALSCQQVRNQEAGVPQLIAVSSAVGFGALNLDIHSYSADWLYQAMLFIFSGTIKSQVEEALDSAVHTVSIHGVVMLLETICVSVCALAISAAIPVWAPVSCLLL